MNDLFKIIIGAIIGIMIIGGALMIFSGPSDNVANDTDNNTTTITETVQEKVNDFQQNGEVNITSSNTNTTYTISSNANSNSTGNSQQGDSSGVQGGYVQQNAQEGDGYLYQINYDDGNFRQYDTRTGELIGSSFDEDQEKLGVVDGNLV